MEIKTTNPIDKQKLLEWMRKWAWGIKNARKADDITPFVRFGNRYFRSLISELKHEGLIGSLSNTGYWAIRLDNKDDIQAAINSEIEMRKRALSMLENCQKNMARFREHMARVDQGQGMMF